MNHRKVSFILSGLLLGILVLRFAGIHTLQPSLGLDSVYLQTVNIFSKMEGEPVASVFNPQLEQSLPLDACYPGAERLYEGSFFNVFAGNLVLTETDFEVYPRSPKGAKNPLSFKRHYNSTLSPVRSLLGFGWSPFWDIRLWLVEDVYVFRWPTGDLFSFKYDAKQNRYLPLARAWMRFSMTLQNNTILLKDDQGQGFEFSIGEKGTRFQLSKIHHGTGILYGLKWDSEGQRVEAVNEEPTGRKTEYSYDSETKLLSSVTFPSGKKIKFEYDRHQNLSRVLNDSETYQRMYLYDDPSFHHRLTAIAEGSPDAIQRKFYYNRQKLDKIETPGFGEVSITRDSLLGLCQVQWMNGAVWLFHNAGDSTELVEGPQGFREKVTFGDLGLPVKITDSQNLATQNSWNDRGQLIQREDARQAIESFDYDVNHNLVGYTDRLGNSTEFQYENGLLKRTITPNHDVFRYSYFENLLETMVCENDKSQRRFRYDKSGLPLIFENEKRMQTHYKHNADGYLIEKTSPGQWTEAYTWTGNQLVQVSYVEQDGVKRKQSSFAYGPSGRVTSITNSSDQKTKLEYDLLGRLTLMSDYTGRKKQFSWSGEGLLLKTSEDNGPAFQYTYDLLGRLVKITKNDKISWNFKYEKSAGIPIAPFSRCFSSIEDPQNLATQLSYDKNYLVSSVRLPDGRAQTFEYNPEDLITTQTWPSQEKFSYAYDKSRHVESIYRHSEDKVTLYSHDWRGHLLSGTDADYQTLFVGYDALGNPVSLQKGIGTPVLEWRWDDDRRLKEISAPTRSPGNKSPSNQKRSSLSQTSLKKEIGVNGFSRTTSLFETQRGYKEWTRTPAGNEEASVDPMGRSVENTYYDNGKLKTKTLRNSNVDYTYVYDLATRLKRMTGVAPCEYTWSDDGQLLKLTFDKKTILLMAYTDDGKLVKKTYPGLLVQQNKWSANGLLENISENSLDPVQYEYDAAGRVLWIRYPNKVNTQVEYDPQGRTLALLTTNAAGDILFKRAYGYDTQNRLTQISTERGELQAVRDVDGKLLSQTCDDKSHSSFSYTYNDKGQIETVRRKDAQGETLHQWVFDPERSLLQKIVQKEPAPSAENAKGIRTNLYGSVLFDSGFLEVNKEVVQTNDKKFQLDNVTLKPGVNNISVRYINSTGRESKNEFPLEYDPTAVGAFLYDLNGKMIFQSQEGRNVSYQYNDEGALETASAMSGAKLKTTKYQYYGNGLLCFRQTEVAGDASQSSNTKVIFDEQENIVGEFADQDGAFDALYMFSPEGKLVYRIDRGHKKFYYHLDKDGSVIGITNHLGQVVCSYAYDFQGQTIEKKETIPNPFLYLGHYYDANADTYFHKGFVGNPSAHFQFFKPEGSSGIILEEPSKVLSRVFSTYTQAFPRIPDPFDWVPAPSAVEAYPFIPSTDTLSQPETWACRPSHEPDGWQQITNVKTVSKMEGPHPFYSKQNQPS